MRWASWVPIVVIAGLSAARAAPGDDAARAGALVDQALDDYLFGDYAGAIEKSERAVRLHDLPKAWRTIATSACFIGDAKRVVEAWKHVGPWDRQFIEYVCHRRRVQLPPEIRTQKLPTKPTLPSLARWSGRASATRGDRPATAPEHGPAPTPTGAAGTPPRLVGSAPDGGITDERGVVIPTLVEAQAPVDPAEELIAEAVDEYILGDFAAAAARARRALELGDSWKAWRIIAACGCARRQRREVMAAWPHLAPWNYQFIQFACERNRLRVP